MSTKMIDIAEELASIMQAMNNPNVKLSEEDKVSTAFAVLAFRAGFDYGGKHILRSEAETSYFSRVRQLAEAELRKYNQ